MSTSVFISPDEITASLSKRPSRATIASRIKPASPSVTPTAFRSRTRIRNDDGAAAVAGGVAGAAAGIGAGSEVDDVEAGGGGGAGVASVVDAVVDVVVDVGVVVDVVVEGGGVGAVCAARKINVASTGVVT